MSPHSLTKYSISSSEHLFVSYAILIRSDANYSSKSNRSKPGGGKSFMQGKNTAACSYGIGVSNWGGIKVNASCLIPKVLNKSIDSGTKSVSNLYKLLLNSVVKSLGISSLSYRHERKRSARAVMSGTWLYSLISASSSTNLSNSASLS
jgi:hypothetical protein